MRQNKKTQKADRPYKKAWSEEETRDYLQEQAGTPFDPNAVRAFKELIEEEHFLSTHDKS